MEKCERETKRESVIGYILLNYFSFLLIISQFIIILPYTLYQEQAVFGKLKMDPAKRAQTQNAGEV